MVKVTEPQDDRDQLIAELRAELARRSVQDVQREDLGGDAGPVLEGLVGVDRAEPLPYEEAMNKAMADAEAKYAELSSLVARQADELARQADDVRRFKTAYGQAIAALGPPAISTYAKALYDKLVSHRNAHPDLPPDHFARVISAVTPLHQAAVKLDNGEGSTKDVAALAQAAADAADRFISKEHPRKSTKQIDYSALASDIEYLLDEAAKAAA